MIEDRMMSTNIQNSINQYFDWLKSESFGKKINNSIEFTFPYLTNSNDYIQIYETPLGPNEFELSDDGFMISDLEAHGIKLEKRRKELLNRILTQYGLALTNDLRINIISSKDDLPKSKHMLIQGLLAIDDMHMLSRPHIENFFADDIQAYFDAHDIYYTENPIFSGKSGYDWKYNFVLQRSKTKPERLCKAINSPSKQQIENALFGWADTKDTRRPETKLILFMNDTEKEVTSKMESACHNYQVDLIKWSEKDSQNNLDKLTA